MLQNAYFLAKIGFDTAENEQHFAKILPKIGNYPTGPPGALVRRSARSGGGAPAAAAGPPKDLWARYEESVGAVEV